MEFGGEVEGRSTWFSSGDDVTTPELVITGGDKGHQRVKLARLQSVHIMHPLEAATKNEQGSGWIRKSSLKCFCLIFVHLFSQTREGSDVRFTRAAL